MLYRFVFRVMLTCDDTYANPFDRDSDVALRNSGVDASVFHADVM